MIGNPFGRRRAIRAVQRAAETQVESALRRSLATHAFETPDADELTTRILAATEDAGDRQRAGDRPHRVADERSERGAWKTWGLPLVAAASVAAVVGIGVAVADYHPGNSKNRAATEVPSSTHVPTSLTGNPTPDRTSSTRAIRSTSGLTSVRILDLTFYTLDNGIALVSAQCIHGSGRCTALLQTSDGENWNTKADTPFDVAGVKQGCPAAKCVDHIRFATSQIGYVYGPSAMFMTTDGGMSWQPQSGGAVALETLDQNVIRVSTANGCTYGCRYEVQTAPLASADWTIRTLPGSQGKDDSVTLVRSEHSAMLESFGNLIGKSSSERAVLWNSADDGATWTRLGEPCPKAGGEVDSAALTAASDGSFTIACRPRDKSRQSGFTITTIDNGQDFTRSTSIPGTVGGSPLVASPASSILIAGNNTLQRSVNGGQSWQRAQGPTVNVLYIGFESDEVGRAFQDRGDVLWTTRDAGRTWTSTMP